MPVAVAIAAINGLVSTIKTVSGSFHTASKKELRAQLDVLTNQASDTSTKVMELVNENGNLSARITELEAKLKHQDEFVFHDNALWRELPDGIVDGPYCAPCFEASGKRLHLHATKSIMGNTLGHRCPGCGTYSNYTPPPMTAPSVL